MRPLRLRNPGLMGGPSQPVVIGGILQEAGMTFGRGDRRHSNGNSAIHRDSKFMHKLNSQIVMKWDDLGCLEMAKNDECDHFRTFHMES